MRKLTILCFAMCLILASSAMAMAQKKAVSTKFTTSGNFNGITTDENGESGGIAVYLTESDGDMYALVTTAAGVLLLPKLLEVKVTGKDMRGIEFTLPDENGDRKFKGKVSAAALTLDENGTKSVLKRVCNGTYNDIRLGEGGDYGGMEVYLTEADGQNYALVTIAEGILIKPELVEAQVTGKNYDRVAFTLPGDGGGRKFTGTKSKTGLTLTESGTRTVLKNKCYK